MSEIMNAGIELMVTGMSIVFGFLTMLVLAVNMLKLLVQRYFPVQQNCPQKIHVSATTGDSSVIAAITAAVTHKRNKHH